MKKYGIKEMKNDRLRERRGGGRAEKSRQKVDENSDNVSVCFSQAEAGDDSRHDIGAQIQTRKRQAPLQRLQTYARRTKRPRRNIQGTTAADRAREARKDLDQLLKTLVPARFPPLRTSTRMNRFKRQSDQHLLVDTGEEAIPMEGLSSGQENHAAAEREEPTTPRIVVERVDDDDDDDDDVMLDDATSRANGVAAVPHDDHAARKESTTSYLTEGSQRSSVSRRLSTSLHIDIDVDDDPEFQVLPCACA